MIGRFGLILALAALVVASGCNRDDEEGKNVVLLTVDTLRADRLGAYGYEEADTPHLDALIGSGTRFDRATVPMPRTTPALASLMTGLWPHHHGSREVSMPFATRETLARVLASRGYQTIGLSANAAAQKEQGFARGFRHFGNHNLARARKLTDMALRLAEKADPARPLFLWVHYVDPHWPYAPPEHEQEGSTCADLEKDIKSRELTPGLLHVNALGKARTALEDCSERYDREIAHVDESIGRLIEGLRELGRFDNAIVVFAADHGENLGEDDLYYEHGPSVHRASTRIPLAIRLPGQTEWQADGRIARIEDVMPTLLELLDVPADARPEMDGHDLSARVRGESQGGGGEELYAFIESAGAMDFRETGFLVSGRLGGRYCLNEGRYSYCLGRSGELVGLYDHEEDPKLLHDVREDHPEILVRFRRAAARWKPETARSLAIRDERFKLVAHPLLSGGRRLLLYDLTTDPDQTRDVSSAHPKAKRRLARELDRWAADLPSYQPPQRTESGLERLRALGYLD